MNHGEKFNFGNLGIRFLTDFISRSASYGMKKLLKIERMDAYENNLKKS